MVTFLLFMLAGIGITNLVVNASILDYPRDFVISKSDFFEKLLTCMMCSGFWVGFFMGLVGGMNPLFAGAIISLLSFMFSYVIEYMEIVIAIKTNELNEMVEDDE